MKFKTMKFNWGTGIFIFIILFLLACTVFIIFAARQDVNLVYNDYYEKGVDYTEEMKIKERSVIYKDAFEIIYLDKYLVVDIDEELAAKIDSGEMLLYRPSDRKQDVYILLEKNSSKITFPKNKLISGRYILKFHWYHNEKRFELNRPVNVQ